MGMGAHRLCGFSLRATVGSGRNRNRGVANRRKSVPEWRAGLNPGQGVPGLGERK